MDFYFYEGEGGLTLGGCAIVRRTVFYITKYSPGSLVYVCKTAAFKGTLEPVYIKEVKLVSNYGVVTPLYKDTYNWLYNESDLCTQSEAVVLAIAYQESVIAACQNQLVTCTPRPPKPYLPGRHRRNCCELNVRPNPWV
jgi:hypothetical protein